MANVSPKYQKYAEGYSKHLKHKNPEKRRKAAQMVGELGVADAIPDLIWMMNKDPDPEVRKIARYSLGMFAAFRDATESEDAARREAAANALRGVVTDLAVGKAASPSNGVLRGVLIGLVGLFVVLAGGNAFVLYGLNGGQLPALVAGGGVAPARGNTSSVNPDAPRQDPVVLAEAALQRIDLLLANTEGLAAKMQVAADGAQPGPGECPFPYRAAAPLALHPQDAREFRTIATTYDTLNTTLAAFDAAHNAAEAACDGTTPLTADTATPTLAEIAAFRDAAPALADAMRLITNPPTATPPPAATETPLPTATATPTYQTTIGQLYNIIDEVQGQRGANTLLAQYWAEARDNAGVTNGCRNPRPDIPPNYDVLLPEELEAAPVELRTAINNINDGLQVLRDGWTSFEAACAGGEPAVQANAPTGLQVTETVSGFFSSADQSLQVFRGVNAGGAS